MADKNATKTKKKRTLTVRERAQSSATTTEKPKRVRKTASKAASPFRALGRLLAKVFSPFAFMLRPFKTRPMRFIGRILKKILLINYVQQSWKELKQVTWPSRKETTQLTIAVFLFALIFGLIIALVDFGLDKLFREILLS